jgi:molybdopterin-containing oxidoreductase family iron-sulfur binding subunit
MKGLSRRDFVKLAAGVAVAIAAPPGYLFIREHSQGKTYPETSDGPQWAMLIDQNQCIGCNRCTWGCKATNDFPGDVWWNIVYSQKVQVGTVTRNDFLARPCMMCENPPCVDVCPVQATYKRPGDGLVVMDYQKCIGCRYCMAACPYGARYFNWKAPDENNPAVPEFGTPEVPRRPRGVVEKCTFCVQRLDAALAKGLTPGIDPAVTPNCVNVCPVPARFFGDLRNGKVSHPKFGDRLVSSFLPKSTHLKNELGLKPRVYYMPLEGT